MCSREILAECFGYHIYILSQRDIKYIIRNVIFKSFRAFWLQLHALELLCHEGDVVLVISEGEQRRRERVGDVGKPGTFARAPCSG